MSRRSKNQVAQNRIQCDLKDLPEGVIEALQFKAKMAGGISVTAYIKTLVIKDTIAVKIEATPFDISSEGQKVHKVSAPWER